MSTTPSMRVLAAGIRSAVPMHIEGLPGQTKTAKLGSLASSWGYHHLTLSANARDKGDFMGMPVEVDGGTYFSPPQWARELAAAPRRLLILDEFSTAGEVFKLMLRIVQEKQIGEFDLPQDSAIIAISNPPDVAVDGSDLPGPIANRFMHLDWHFDFESWAFGMLTDFAKVEHPALARLLVAESAQPARYAKEVGAILAFLRVSPQLQTDMPRDLVGQSKGWASPRSWHNAARVLSHLREDDDEARMLALKGCVGQGAARAYIAWVVEAGLYDPREVMNDPTMVPWASERPDRIFALMGGIQATVLAEGSRTAWAQGARVLVACAEGGKPDAATPAARWFFGQGMPDGARVPSGAQAAFAGLLARMPRRTAV